ncbi:MAG: 4-hydroxythreonine-4-phosphate dehydrogenase PdxA [Candidatus Omnitrophica bacterium]|nr:4-hydroxythreonine-4-phosphate dehydrogenase PdxA [Candidatus Omnitrophota bacterium]
MPRFRYPVTVGITMGDPASASPQALAASLSRLAGLARFVVIGDAGVYRKAARIAKASTCGAGCDFLDLKNVPLSKFSFGRPKAAYGRASLEYIDAALGLLRERRIDCLVTGPVSKEHVNAAGVHFTGHTEYIAAAFKTADYAMMLLNNKLKVTLATRHIALEKVSRALNAKAFRSAAALTHKWLKVLFALRSPRIVVCGLNPHASDNGLIGNNENILIKPLIRSLRARGVRIEGPISAEAALLKTAEGAYDAAIAMYHDQAMVALKLSDASSGVNLTLGLPFVRTSPLHGTAFDIAGTQKVSPASFTAAIKTAAACSLRYARYRSSHARRS